MKKQTVQAHIIELEEKTWAVHNPMLNRANGGAMSSGNTVFLVSFETADQEIMTFAISERETQFFSVGQSGKLTYRGTHFIKFTNLEQEEVSSDPVRDTFFYVLITAVAVLVLTGLGFLIYTWALQSSYRETAQEINQVVQDADYTAVTAAHNGATIHVGKFFVQKYNKLLQAQKTKVFNREAVYDHGDRISFDFGTGKLEFCRADDIGMNVNIHWQTETTDRYYTVQSEISYEQLEKEWKDYMIELQRRKNQ